MRVGQSKRPDDYPSLDELIDELSLAMNAKSVLQGQISVCTTERWSERTWCFAQHSDVLSGLETIEEHRAQSIITCRPSGSVYITNGGCSFVEFIEAHKRDFPPFRAR
jgi:hypothetical protein